MGDFNVIPENIRIPLFYVEHDASRAGFLARNTRSLLIGQRLTTGTKAANEPLLVIDADQAAEFFGRGSMLHAMVGAFRQNNGFNELWCVALDDDGAAVAATGALGFTGPATAAGTLSLYIDGQRVRVAVASGDTADAIASAVATEIAGDPDLTVAAAVNGIDNTQVDLTARNKGEAGNDIDLRVNYLGELGGEKLPAGVTVTVTAMTGGATNPDVAGAFAALADEEFDYIAMPYTDTANLDTVALEMNQLTGRWAFDRQVFGHVFTARRGTVAALQTFGSARNDEHVTVLGYDGSPTNPARAVSMMLGQVHRAIDNHAARPLHSLELVGFQPPVESRRFTNTEKNTLAFSGVSFLDYKSTAARLSGVFTTYQKNEFGLPDTAYLKVNTLYQNMVIVRRLRFDIVTSFGRSILNDGVLDAIRARVIATYEQLQREEIVENSETFARLLRVERHPQNPNRVNIFVAPDHVNQLDVVAVRNQFRLQYRPDVLAA